MRKFAILVAGLAVLFAVPASAQTVGRGHGGHDGARAARGHGMGSHHGTRARGHGHGRPVVIKRRGHHHHR